MPNAYQQYLLNQVDRCKSFARFVAADLQPGEFTRFHALAGGAKALVIARAQQRSGRPVLVVAADAESSEVWYDDLAHFGAAGLLHFPMAETLPYEVEEPVIEIVARQYSTLYYLARGERPIVTAAPEENAECGMRNAEQKKKAGDRNSSLRTQASGLPSTASSLQPPAFPLIVAPIEALHRKVPSREDFERLFLTFWWGERLDLGAVARRFVEMGYVRESMTETRGEFSIRGHIVDVFPPHFDNPVRFDLFGDEIESIRFFDAGTQRSLPCPGGDPERVTILPARTQSIAESLARRGRPLVSLLEWLPEDTLVVLDAPEKYDAALEQLDRITLRNHEERLGTPNASQESALPEMRASQRGRGKTGTLPESLPPSRRVPPPNLFGGAGDADEEDAGDESGLVAPSEGLVLPPATLFATAKETRAAFDRFAQVWIPAVEVEREHDREPAVYHFGAVSFENLPTELDTFLSLIKSKQKQEYSVHVVCDNDGQVMRLDELMREHEITSRVVLEREDGAPKPQAGGWRPETVGQKPQAGKRELTPADSELQAPHSASPASDSSLQPPASSLPPPASSLGPQTSSLQPPASSLLPPASSLQPPAYSLRSSASPQSFRPHDVLEGYQEVVLVTGPLQNGFVFPEALLLIITDREMFGRYKRRHVYRKAYKGRPIASAAEIRPGDFVVHMDHGIGRFLGIRRQEIDGRATELLDIEYAERNKLLLPIENVGRIQKYSSVEGATPALDRLGGTRWINRRKKSQEKIEQMAQELLEIYAKRAVAAGFAFGADTTWQSEFEDSFIYDETPDQLRAIDEVKADMCQARAMDRLLCGDVGFGKTEVAMRAAFKAVQEKRQVAILVPTTILAQQHYTTFRERFAEYPVRTEVLSRFRSEAEQAETVRQVKYGGIDIIIGTHRLLSADVQFADLGLLIIDEEHRFGVRQKEKIKAMRASVDILTLSATPIPRTLYMALSGLRDMSVINTPPRDRLPIRTRVIRFIPEEIEQAILRELNRGGQIYFVHNRVRNIAGVARRLREIVPQARIAVAHGQMLERDLEQVMLDFIDRKYDILLSTTIIESGLDIPNVNTIIINRADAFGLAQLYQLRGRVGRDVKRAYAYLIIPDGRPITDTAIRRLRAIEEFTELGMGFQVAMRDLEIRGTGNILGAEQHGAIEAVGFDLYCHLLEEAVQRLRGETRDDDFPVEVKWNVAAFLPAEYVPVESQRIAFYRRCATAREPKNLEDLTEELRDRFGALPAEAANLVAISTLRLLARRCWVERIFVTPRGFKLTPRADALALLRDAQRLRENNQFKEIRSISAEGSGTIVFEYRKWQSDKGLEAAARVLHALAHPA
jgi:transcription-repair coupling factor